VKDLDWLDGDIALPPGDFTIFHPLSPLNRRLRREFIAGAEEDSRRRLGRGLTAEELVRVVRYYPGDIGHRRAP
jgi:hypothetical protein